MKSHGHAANGSNFLAKLLAGLLGRHRKSAIGAKEVDARSRNRSYARSFGYAVTASGAEWHRDAQGNLYPFNTAHDEFHAAVVELAAFFNLSPETVGHVQYHRAIERLTSSLQVGLGIPMRSLQSHAYPEGDKRDWPGAHGTDHPPSGTEGGDPGREGQNTRRGFQLGDPPIQSLEDVFHHRKLSIGSLTVNLTIQGGPDQ